MTSKQAWQPTKFVQVGRRWRSSRDPKEIAISSRLIGDLTVSAYHEAIERYATGSLVDLGCGKAPLYGIYRDKVDSVTCVDWEESLHGPEFVDRTMDLNAPFAFTDESFDTVLVTDVLEHIRHPSLFWSEMARICKNNGHVIIGTPFLCWIHENPHDYARYTRYNLLYECQKNQLTVVFMTEYGGGPEVICCLAMKMMRQRPKTCLVADLAARFLLSLRSIKKYSKSSRELFPLGYCMVASKTWAYRR